MTRWPHNMPKGATEKDCKHIANGCLDLYKKCGHCRHNIHNQLQTEFKSYFEPIEKKKRIKVRVADDKIADFLIFCAEKGIEHKQYPEPLRTRFGMNEEDKEIIEQIEGIISIEAMPEVSLG